MDEKEKEDFACIIELTHRIWKLKRRMSERLSYSYSTTHMLYILGDKNILVKETSISALMELIS